MEVSERSTTNSNGAGKGGIRVSDYATPETRMKGTLRSAEVRAERAKSLRQRFAEKLDEDAEELYDSFKRAWLGPDWRAADAAITQAFGKPDGHMSVDIAGQLEVEHSRRLTLADVAALTVELGAVTPVLEPADPAD